MPSSAISAAATTSGANGNVVSVDRIMTVGELTYSDTQSIVEIDPVDISRVNPANPNTNYIASYPSGNLPNVSEIAPLLIVIRLEQLDYAGAAALGMIMLLVSFVLLALGSWLSGRATGSATTR